VLFFELFLDKSNKRNHKSGQQIQGKLSGSVSNFKITNNRFGISAVYDSANKKISFNYHNQGGKRKIELAKLKSDQLLYQDYQTIIMNTKSPFSLMTLLSSTHNFANTFFMLTNFINPLCKCRIKFIGIKAVKVKYVIKGIVTRDPMF